MDAFPSRITAADGDAHTGMICPDCGGSLITRAAGGDAPARTYLVFQCRVGHRFTLEDLLNGKEEQIERAMWMAVYAYEELVALLRDLAAWPGGDGRIISEDQSRERIERADTTARALRELILQDRVIKLNHLSD
jgi:two-component system chemotaxis response regulator CheB